jgi:hypothetical protein
MSSQIFSTFSVILLVLGHLERSSSSTDTWPALKHNVIQKLLSDLKNNLQRQKHFKNLGSRFTESHAKLDVKTLFDFAIHRRQNET